MATPLLLSYDVPVTRQNHVGKFGDKFRQAREKKELSLDDVSNVTKIGSRMLRAIEEERFDQLPGGVFNKGFIRAYAKHLGLNDEEAVTDYLACLRQAQIDSHEVWEPQRPASARPSVPVRPGKVEPKQSEPLPAAKSQPAPPVEELPELQLPRAQDVRPRRRDFAGTSAPEIPWRILALAAVVVILALVLWTRRSHNTNTADASTYPAKPVPAKLELAKLEPAKLEPTKLASTKPAPARTMPAAVPVPMPKPTSQSSPASGAMPTPAHASTPNSQPLQPGAAAAAALPATARNNVGDKARDNDDKNTDNQNDGTVRAFPKTSPQPSAKAAAPLTLVIRATETSWISVTADGQPVSHETLIAPAHTSVRATREIVARIGNAAGVSFVWNGQQVPADGAEGEVKTFVFDSAGMRVIPSAPPSAQNR